MTARASEASDGPVVLQQDVIMHFFRKRLKPPPCASQLHFATVQEGLLVCSDRAEPVSRPIVKKSG